MKNFNKNIPVFLAVLLIVICGYSKSHLKTFYNATVTLVSQISSGNISQGFEKFTDTVDNKFSKGLRYHDGLMDIDSLKNNILGTEIIEKDSDTIVKTDGGSLVKIIDKLSDKELDETVDRIEKLYKKATEQGAKFLYAAAPLKGYNFTLPENIANYTTTNFDSFTSKLTKAGIPTVNLAQEMIEENIYGEDSFFITDHHWKPQIGLWACGKICDILNEMYAFEYDSDNTDISNYDVTTYENYFLGSYGKKVGTYFAGMKTDDIDILTPKFLTDLTEEQPFKNQVRTGSFEDTVIFKENISVKDYYNKNPYATYSGGDFRLQIIKNNLNTDGDKILLVRDSFACVVSPFLSLNASELLVVDVRDYNYFVGEKLNVHEFIEKTKPDYVVVLYTGSYSLKTSDGRFDFE